MQRSAHGNAVRNAARWSRLSACRRPPRLCDHQELPATTRSPSSGTRPLGMWQVTWIPMRPALAALQECHTLKHTAIFQSHCYACCLAETQDKWPKVVRNDILMTGWTPWTPPPTACTPR